VTVKYFPKENKLNDKLDNDVIIRSEKNQGFVPLTVRVVTVELLIGIFLMISQNRLYCGKCRYTSFDKEEIQKASK